VPCATYSSLLAIALALLLLLLSCILHTLRLTFNSFSTSSVATGSFTIELEY
jgi:hypothetical protein